MHYSPLLPPPPSLPPPSFRTSTSVSAIPSFSPTTLVIHHRVFPPDVSTPSTATLPDLRISSLSLSLSLSRFFFCLSSHVPTRLFHVKKKKSEISPSKSRAADATRRHHTSRNWMEGTIFLLLLRDRGGEGIFIARLIKPCKFKFEASRIF